MCTETANATSSVSEIRLVHIRRRLSKDELVEEVVDEEHLRRRVALGAVDVAVERGVGDVEGGLPDVGELVDDVGHGCEVGRCVHECYEALAAVDHGAEGGPVGCGHCGGAGRIGQGVETCRLEYGRVLGGRKVIAVYDQECEDFVWVGVHPFFHCKC